jgi:hypothetical protein
MVFCGIISRRGAIFLLANGDLITFFGAISIDPRFLPISRALPVTYVQQEEGRRGVPSGLFGPSILSVDTVRPYWLIASGQAMGWLLGVIAWVRCNCAWTVEVVSPSAGRTR